MRDSHNASRTMITRKSIVHCQHEEVWNRLTPPSSTNLSMDPLQYASTCDSFLYFLVLENLVNVLTCLTKATKTIFVNQNQWCGLRPSVLGQDQSEAKKIGLGLARCGLGLSSLALCCETRSCHACRHNDLEGHSNFSSTIYSFSILCLEHHYRGDQQWRSLS